MGLSLAASHLAATTGHHPQHSLKKHRMDNGDYYENGHLGERLCPFLSAARPSFIDPSRPLSSFRSHVGTRDFYVAVASYVYRFTLEARGS